MSTSPRRFRHACCRGLTSALAAATLLSASGRTVADDVVRLVPRDGTSVAPAIPGQIVDFTGQELRLRLAGGRERVIKPDEIEAIETTRCAEQVAGDELFAGGDFRLAEAKYRAAVETDREVRGWVRRQIFAQIIWCQQATGKWDQAGETFLKLVASDPHTQYFDCIPLNWIAERPTAALERNAQAWLTATEPVEGLLGASHLLATDQHPAAIERLRSLTKQPLPRVAWLAQTQLWRVDAVRAGPEDLDRWSRAIEANDPSLRAGPCFVLGAALASRDPERAAIALLEVPILYPRQRQLAAAALLLAGGCLEKAGQQAQAGGLYRELIAHHAGAAERGEAERRLDSLKDQPSQR